MSSPARRSLRFALGVAIALLAVLLAVVVAGATYGPETAIPEGLAGRHVDVAGISLRIEQRGAGRDVLLVHGSPGSIEDWSAIVGPLSARYRVTAYDRPGHGFSGDDGQHTFVRNAAIARALVDELRLEHVLVVGHSYGGTTALAMALEPSPRVDGVVVLDSATYRGAREPTMLLRILRVPWVGTGLARVMPSGVANGKIREGLAQQFRETPPAEEFLALRARIWGTPKVAHTIADETLGATGWLRELSPRYPTIEKPVAILGQADDAFRRESLEHLHRDIRGSTLTLLPGTGHFLQFERPREVIEAIEGMDARVPVRLAAHPPATATTHGTRMRSVLMAHPGRERERLAFARTHPSRRERRPRAFLPERASRARQDAPPRPARPWAWRGPESRVRRPDSNTTRPRASRSVRSRPDDPWRSQRERTMARADRRPPRGEAPGH
jgi:pimeloyl-ACP methyl ester carboxylesterase